MEQGKQINSLTRVELTTLLKWHKVLKPGDAKVDERRAKFKSFWRVEWPLPPISSGRMMRKH